MPTKQNSTYRLLNLVSRQPIQLSRFVAKMLAGLVNHLKISKTSNTICLNLNIAFPDLPEAERERICRTAFKMNCVHILEFLVFWGASNEKISAVFTIFMAKKF